MNAYELADELEKLYQQDCIDGVADLSMPESANMLRQQADKLHKYELRNIAQCDRIAILEAQVYGGTTK